MESRGLHRWSTALKAALRLDLIVLYYNLSSGTQKDIALPCYILCTLVIMLKLCLVHTSPAYQPFPQLSAISHITHIFIRGWSLFSSHWGGFADTPNSCQDFIHNAYNKSRLSLTYLTCQSSFLKKHGNSSRLFILWNLSGTGAGYKDPCKPLVLLSFD